MLISQNIPVKSSRVSKSSKAGLIFPVGRIGRYMRSKAFSPQVGDHAAVMLAAAMEFLCAEMLEIAGEIC